MGPRPYLGQNPLASEPFSSSGPSIIVRNPDGTLMTDRPVTVQNPTITAPDGGNTSFFRRAVIDTSNPPLPGPAGDADEPVAEPAQLLRHVVGGPQRRGRGGPHDAEGARGSPRPRSGQG